MGKRRQELSLAVRIKVFKATRVAYLKRHDNPDVENLVREEIKTKFASVLIAFLLNIAVSLAVSYIKDWIKKRLNPTDIPTTFYSLEEDPNGQEEANSDTPTTPKT